MNISEYALKYFLLTEKNSHLYLLRKLDASGENTPSTILFTLEKSIDRQYADMQNIKTKIKTFGKRSARVVAKEGIEEISSPKPVIRRSEK